MKKLKISIQRVKKVKADAYRENLRKGVDIKQPTASKEQEVKENRKIEEDEKNVTSGKVNEPDKDDAER